MIRVWNGVGDDRSAKRQTADLSAPAFYIVPDADVDDVVLGASHRADRQGGLGRTGWIPKSYEYSRPGSPIEEFLVRFCCHCTHPVDWSALDEGQEVGIDDVRMGRAEPVRQ